MDRSMKKLIPFLLVAFLFAACDVRAAAPVIANSGAQHCANFALGGTAVNCSLPNNVTAGNMIVVYVGADDAGRTTINTPTMTGETFSKVTGCSNGGGTNKGQVACYTVNSAAGGQKQVTVTLTVAADPHIHVAEISGQTGSPIDATGNTESTTMSVSTSGATTNATDLMIAFFYDNANNHILAPTAPYATIDTSNGGTNNDFGLSESNTSSSTGVQTAAATGNAGNTIEQGIIAIAGTGAAAPSGGTNKRQKQEQMDPS